MARRTVLITGASSGIGLEAAVALAGPETDLVLVARDETKGERTRAEVARRSGASGISVLPCDLASLASVKALAASFRESHGRLDVLINNAGTVSPDRRVSADGFEMTFAVNHLAHFLLTTALLDVIIGSGASRIVNVSSEAHRSGTMDFDDLQFENGYSLLRAYSRSKLANVLFTRSLAERLAGTAVTVNALHPGAVRTNIWSHTNWYTKPIIALVKPFMISAEEGGSRIAFLAASPDVEGKTGGYYDKNTLREPAPLALDAALAEHLWQLSAEAIQGI